MRLRDLAFAFVAAAPCVVAADAASGCAKTDFQSKPDGGSLGGDGSADGAIDVPVSCSPETADSAKGVFVDQAVGSDASCGSLTVPCKTINAGIAAANATANKTIVYVATGTYEEQIRLTGPLTNASLTIEGAWRNSGGSFERQCDNDPVGLVTIVPQTENVTVDARGFSGNATLSLLTLKSKAADPAPGESLYGVFVRGDHAQVTLRDISMRLGAAGAGASAEQPAQPVAAAAACDTPGTAQVGAPAQPALVAAASTYGSDGFVPAGGSTGGDGNAGTNGTAGTADACITAFTCDPGDPECGGTQEQHCGAGGKPGCGGAPGTGGAGGAGGGSSIGIFVWQGRVIVGNAHVTAGAGGAGGAGAPGGRGGAAGAGGPPSVDTWNKTCYKNGASCVEKDPSTVSGTAGTAGGAGSDGASGSGGVGGDSYCYVKGADATISLSGSRCTFGAPGAAGAGTPAAAAGTAAESK